MAKTENGGSAFPDLADGGGMSLRDYFAGQALPAIIAKIPLVKDADPHNVFPEVPSVTVEAGQEIRAGAAVLAYRYAAALLFERGKV